jgi:hypothetical protein
VVISRLWLATLIVGIAGAGAGRAGVDQSDLAVLDHSTIDCPGAVGTGLTGISDSGRIVGAYITGDFVFHGMVLVAGGACQTVDYPGALATVLTGVNNAGQAAGWRIDPDDQTRAFIWNNGVFEDVVPAPLPPGYTAFCDVSVGNINNLGQVVGFVEVTNSDCDHGRDVGFIRQPNGTYEYPAGPYGPAYGFEFADISATGWAVGMGFSPTSGPEVAVMRSPQGVYEPDVVYPSGPGCSVIKTQFTGINPRGEAIGDFTCAEDPPYLGNDFLNSRAFLRDRTGALSPLTVPGAVRTVVVRTNASGLFVGIWFDDDDQMHGFVGSLNLVQNGGFDGGTTNWLQFALPDMTHIVSQVTDGVFEYYRVPAPPGTPNQATVYQETEAPMIASAPLVARFRVGNSSTVRKRISALVLDSDFTDLSVCTFWLEPNTPLTAYEMRTHTTKPWANAAVYFYAASAGASGGFYRLDDVSLNYAWAGPTSETTCVDPRAPAPPGGTAGPDWLVNGNFDTGTLAPWGIFGQISFQIAAGVFEFLKLEGTPSGVVLQTTGQTPAANDILTATFQLGNSSAVRKRVTVIVHDYDFSDLSACTFWLSPGQPLSDYSYRTFATTTWTNATLSVYPATIGTEQWIRLDNAALRRTPGTATAGTECVEPGTGGVAAGRRTRGPAGPGRLPPSGDWLSAGFTRASGDAGSEWTATATHQRRHALQYGAPIDLTDAISATLTFRSWLSASASRAEVQVRGAGGNWQPIHPVIGSDWWTPIAIDLAAYLGQVVDVRFVLFGVAPDDPSVPDTWRIDEIVIDIGRVTRQDP